MGEKDKGGGSLMDIAATKSAARRALEYAGELIPEARSASLGGIELDESKNVWEVIIGYVLSSALPFSALAAAATPPEKQRTYKRFVLDAQSLDLQRMTPYDISQSVGH